ncbi:MAG TPA: sigma-70 family RNA polymerase sigma factor [archaeon]|jgi:RNA polymerase sigma-70 factor (ECF subfamily)|nr:sigma-70 family RNA polymerase sigma factor [archaeon]
MKTIEIKTLSFEQVYNEYYPIILNYVRSKINNQLNAEDITAKVFIKVYQNFKTYNSEKGKLNTWIYTIANNTLIDFFRCDKSNNYISVNGFTDDNGKETHEFIASSSYNTDKIIDNMELKKRINRAFNTLKPNYKRIAELFFLDGKKYHEIAEICQIPMGSVKGMINRARTLLQMELA